MPAKLIEKDRPARVPRSGHGAASLIPYLHPVVAFEPSQLSDSTPASTEDNDVPEEKRASGD